MARLSELTIFQWPPLPAVVDPPTGRLARHPLQYAFRHAAGIGTGGQLVYHTEKTPTPVGEAWERYNRCPNCEEWSPCAKRLEIEAKA